MVSAACLCLTRGEHAIATRTHMFITTTSTSSPLSSVSRRSGVHPTLTDMRRNSGESTPIMSLSGMALGQCHATGKTKKAGDFWGMLGHTLDAVLAHIATGSEPLETPHTDDYSRRRELRRSEPSPSRSSSTLRSTPSLSGASSSFTRSVSRMHGRLYCMSRGQSPVPTHSPSIVTLARPLDVWRWRPDVLLFTVGGALSSTARIHQSR